MFSTSLSMMLLQFYIHYYLNRNKHNMENYDDYLQDAFENYEDEHRFDEEGLLEELEGEDE